MPPQQKKFLLLYALPLKNDLNIHLVTPRPVIQITDIYALLRSSDWQTFNLLIHLPLAFAASYGCKTIERRGQDRLANQAVNK